MVFAQKITISGIIRDQQTGETLIGATVYEPSSGLGVSTNDYGFYSISMPSKDSVTLEFSFIGYQTVLKTLPSQSNQTFNLEMSSGQTIEEVVVEANSNKERVNSTQMGVVEVQMKEAKILPAFLGEVDIIRTLQLKPGVLNGGEGQSGVFVRGGGPDQNLFILDEATVYNPSHLFGFFSTFNTDAIKSAELFKSGFPAQYGGRLSSVIDIKMNEGNRKKFSGAGGIGLISSRLTLEGPIVKDKASFIVSGRRTYVDLLTRAFNKANEGKSSTKIPDYYFYDLNGKVNYDINEKNKIFLSGYFGRDVFGFQDSSFNVGFDWGNISSTLRWNHIFNGKLFSNTSFTFSDYNYLIANKFDDFKFSFGSGIRDLNLKSDFSFFPNNKHSMKFGANVIHHRFKVNNLSATSGDSSLNINSGKFYEAAEMAAYFNDDWTINRRLSINMGLRLSGFVNGAFHWGIEPRLAAKYSLTENLSIKANYARAYQYIHLIATSGASLPTDVWYPSNANIRPQIADQVSLGGAYALSKDIFVSLEGFYKWFQNQADFKENANLFTSQDLDNEFVQGKGRAYGLEFYIEKKPGKGNRWHDKMSGWIGYTLSWTERQFDELNQGRWFYPRYDRRHDITLVYMWECAKRLTFSMSMTYNTGNAFSLPDGRALFLDSGVNGNLAFNDQMEATFYNFNLAPVYAERNKYTLPAYFRWDLGLVWDLTKKGSKFKHDLTFSIYNATDRRNPFFVYFKPIDSNGDGVPNRIAPKVVSLFPIIPAITWNFKF